MKNKDLFFLIILTLLFIVTNTNIERSTTPKFYDGEGNPIPNDAVNLLVKSQFVILDTKDMEVIKYYFPAYQPEFEVKQRIYRVFENDSLSFEIAKFILYNDTTHVNFDSQFQRE